MFWDYDKLLEKYKLLLLENQRLKAELASFKGEAQTFETQSKNEAQTEMIASSVNKHSSPETKISLFRSLFKGREDVFARRWYSKTSDKSGYQPVCENEWNEAFCDKKKYKCAACPNRKLMPLTDKDIYNHLSGKDTYGRDVVGIYPMLTDETCLFLCSDFDEENFKSDVSAFRKICEDFDVPVSIEISRSGTGAHAWIFFSEPVAASAARKLGSGILTKAMEKSKLSFKSYDRFFPNQDTMPKGGFGNLVALPLQGNARKKGNSMFVDENFIPYADQWEYLSNIQKISAEKVDDLIMKICKTGELGQLISDSEKVPWENEKQIEFNEDKFPEKLQIVSSNMIYIPTQNLSAGLINKIKRLAAFRNPDFYRSQAMRLPIYNKPRIICAAEIFDDYIALPRGCEDALHNLFAESQAEITVIDKTNPGTKISVEFNGTLREEQQPAADALLEYNIGVLSATTAFGKTVIASYLIGKRKTNTLILVHTQSLMSQWQKALENFLAIDAEPPKKLNSKSKRKPWSPIGVLGAGKDTLNGIVDVAVMQSLIGEDEVKDLARNYGMIIVDECHHVSAVNFEKILKFANAKYVYGLTATPTRQDGHHPIIFMQCGAIRYKVDAKSQAEKRNFEHYLIPRFTPCRQENGDKNITEIYKELVDNEFRNSYIANDIINTVKSGRTPIVLTERREHVLKLKALLCESCDNIITLFGTSSRKQRRENLEKLQAVPSNKSLIIIATGSYIGEGFDYPRLDTLFLALPIAWKGRVAQYAGRLHRNYPGKTEVQIYDYVDVHIPVLEKMYQKRLKGYSSIGYKIKTDDLNSDLIYDGKSFYTTYCRDIKSSYKEILIVSPLMKKSRILQLSKIFAQASLNGASITVITRPPEDFDSVSQEAIKENTAILQDCGVKVICKPNIYQKFTVIDNKIAWYGNINFLSFAAAEESVIRLTSIDIAGELKETVQ